MKKKKYRITYRPMIAPNYVIKNPDEIMVAASIAGIESIEVIDVE